MRLSFSLATEISSQFLLFHISTYDRYETVRASATATFLRWNLSGGSYYHGDVRIHTQCRHGEVSTQSSSLLQEYTLMRGVYRQESELAINIRKATSIGQLIPEFTVRAG